MKLWGWVNDDFLHLDGYVVGIVFASIKREVKRK